MNVLVLVKNSLTTKDELEFNREEEEEEFCASIQIQVRPIILEKGRKVRNFSVKAGKEAIPNLRKAIVNQRVFIVEKSNERVRSGKDEK